MKPYHYAVFIGRMQPFHNAHLSNIEKALEIAEQVIVLVGSSGGARNTRNPFNFIERRNMIIDSLEKIYGDQIMNRVWIRQIRDFLYNDNDWVSEVQGAVFDIIDKFDEDVKVALVGAKKDNTTYYLNLFPQWQFVETEEVPLSAATKIRESFFNGGIDYKYLDVPEPVKKFLRDFEITDEYDSLMGEFLYIRDYKAQFKDLKFPPVFVTVDAVVFCNGHILLVKRNMNPGKGLWALPGGFLGQDEKIDDAVIRELKEETRIELHKNIIRGSYIMGKVFDAPGRSLRGRTITHANLFVLKNIEGLPNVKGSDDAEKAKWFPFIEFANMKEKMFEDHYDIGHFFLGVAR